MATSGPRLRRYGHRIYPYHFIRWSAAGILIFGLAVLLAGQFPPGTGAAIGLERPPVPHPWPWYLEAPRAWLHLFDARQRWVGWSLLLAFVLALFCLPLLDRTHGRGTARRWPFAGVALALVAVVLYLSLREGAP